MDQELLLIEGDGCFTIINKMSVIFDSSIPELKRGITIKYLWPEFSAVQKRYTGTIIGMSNSEKELLTLQNQKLKEAGKRSQAKKRKLQCDSFSESEDQSNFDESSSNVIFDKIQEALQLNKQLTKILEDLKKLAFSVDRSQGKNLRFSSISSAIKDNTPLLSNLNNAVTEHQASTSFNSLLENPHSSIISKSIKEKAVTKPLASTAFNSILENYSEDYEESEGEQHLEKENITGPKLMETEGVVEENNMFIFTKSTAGDKAVELISESDVYIDKTVLKDCKRKATSHNALARMLMSNIFTAEALLQYNLETKKNKEGLPSSVIDVILKYCINVARKNGWRPNNDRAVIDSLRSKLKEIKVKHAHKTQPKK
ncbi:uncharacterized protein LOC127284980 isoform X1 [Leptopilina boulardi]|uniref:uncharacterized protein LOC127284369 isoform X1 n=1 Tax=Leptopilina boulardi TaxID=63433 RepID=UPI0021F6667F|nr:uncharacterized protein LOC127284369 isoform X1 [Leptopilina boulardi]XP_051166678.1 uncharacterized protein LOC127284980 isoform X1 [Leptopilina boulardi]